MSLKTYDRRRSPIPCADCGAKVWHPNMGVCDPCFDRRYDEFARVWGFDLRVHLEDGAKGQVPKHWQKANARAGTARPGAEAPA